MNDRAILDWGAALVVIGSLVGFLPQIAAGLGAIYYCFLLYDRIRYGPKK